MKNSKRSYVIAAVVLALGGLFVAPPAGAAEKVIFGVDWQILGQHIPFFAAVEKGFYKDAGLDVEIVRG